LTFNTITKVIVISRQQIGKKIEHISPKNIQILQLPDIKVLIFKNQLYLKQFYQSNFDH